MMITNFLSFLSHRLLLEILKACFFFSLKIRDLTTISKLEEVHQGITEYPSHQELENRLVSED